MNTFKSQINPVTNQQELLGHGKIVSLSDKVLKAKNTKGTPYRPMQVEITLDGQNPQTVSGLCYDNHLEFLGNPTVGNSIPVSLTKTERGVLVTSRLETAIVKLDNAEFDNVFSQAEVFPTVETIEEVEA